MLVAIATTAALAACVPPMATPMARTSGPRANAKPASSTAAPAAPSPATSQPTRPLASSTAVAPSPATTPAPTAAPTFPPIVAGLTAGPGGHDPLNFPLDRIGDIELADDGTLYIANTDAVWRLPPGGKIQVVAGGHFTPSDDLDGRDGQDVGFGPTPRLALLRDDGKNVLIAHARGLARLRADGTLAELWRAAQDEGVAGAVPHADGGFDLLVRMSQPGASPLYQWRSAVAGGLAVEVRAVTGAEAEIMTTMLPDAWYIRNLTAPAGAAVDGRLIVRTGTPERFDRADTYQPMYALHPDGSAPELLDDGTNRPHFQDSRGRLYRFDSEAGRLYDAAPGQARTPLGDATNLGMRVGAVTSAPDGAVYVACAATAVSDRDQRIFRIAGGTTTLVAGQASSAVGATTATPLTPGGIVATGPAELLTGDRRLGRILRIRPGQPLEGVFGRTDGPPPADGAPAAEAKLAATGLARDGAGQLYVIHDGKSVWRIGEAGMLERLYVARPAAGPNSLAHRIDQVAVTPTGVAYVRTKHVEFDPEYREVESVYRLDGKGGDAPIGLEMGTASIALGPDGDLRLARQAWSEADGFTTVLSRVGPGDVVAEVARPTGFQSTRLLAVDDVGRWWFETSAPEVAIHRLIRYDVAAATTTTVAGHGTPRFGGDTLDTGLIAPLGLAFDPLGDAYVVDDRQIKRVARADQP